MLNDKICQMREKLNESIITGENYEVIYQISVELDELIAEYYRTCNRRKVAKIRNQNTKERLKA